MSKEARESLDPAYQEAIDQAVIEAIEYMRPQLDQIDRDNKKILEDGGMAIFEYDNSFFDEILALTAVQNVYYEINNKQINGLGTLLIAGTEKTPT